MGEYGRVCLCSRLGISVGETRFGIVVDRRDTRCIGESRHDLHDVNSTTSYPISHTQADCRAGLLGKRIRPVVYRQHGYSL